MHIASVVTLAKSPSDEVRFHGVFAACLLVAGFALSMMHAPQLVPHSKPPARILIAVRPHVAPTKVRELVIEGKPILQKKATKDKVAIAKVEVKSPPAVSAPPVEDTPVIIKASASLDAPLLTDLPPPAPDDDKPPPTAYPDKPYGAAVVLAVKVDSNGDPLDVQIVVPSFNSMGDLSFALAAKKIKYTNMQPPPPPGGAIWIEQRIEFVDPLKTALP